MRALVGGLHLAGALRSVLACGHFLSNFISQAANALRFLDWTLSYKLMTLLQSMSPTLDALSPTGSVLVPSDVEVLTPESDPRSPNDASSPIARAQGANRAIKRAVLFASNRHKDLVSSMTVEELRYVGGAPRAALIVLTFRRTTSIWIRQYQLFCFKTATHWGRGPMDWNCDNLMVESSQTSLNWTSLPDTPGANLLGASPRHPLNVSPRDSTSQKVARAAAFAPSHLCRYSAHCAKDQCVDWMDDPQDCEPELPDPHDESTWQEWPDESTEGPEFRKKMFSGLKQNSFSAVDIESLPVAIPQFISSSRATDESMAADAFQLAIMGRNVNLLRTLLDEDPEMALEKKNDLLFLATTYLDGHRSCCTMIDAIGCRITKPGYVNARGHSIFDNMMLTIIRSHTSSRPSSINDDLRDELCFPGEEVDICGRWDADSDCFRWLLSQGLHSVPCSWKHKFCHTSAQTICHALTQICIHDLSTGYLKEPCTLFRKRCFTCGLKMDLTSLHTVVLVGYHLAYGGIDDEDLFGVIAIVLCLMNLGVNPSQTVPVDLQQFNPSRNDTQGIRDQCQHPALTPLEIVTYFMDNHCHLWRPAVQVGWRLLYLVFQYAVEGSDDAEPPTNGNSFFAYLVGPSHVLRKKNLRLLWAAVQTELLTYRRQTETDPWISENFNILKAVETLESGEGLSVGNLTGQGLMRELPRSGRLHTEHPLPRADEVTSQHISNLDENYDRLNILPPPGL